MLKIQSDRIIIDGHEPTKEQCETMTLLANALAESESFKTVKYESGYAEFEKVGKTNILNFVPAPPQDVTVIFDSHIISVNCPSSGNYGGGSWTTSGSTVNGMYDHDLVYLVTLEDGYVIDTVVVSGTEPYHMPVISDDKKSFTGYLTAGEPFTITITSKQTVSRKSVDLTTLPGWSSLSSGSHSITIVAKADGYRDSEPSAAVSVEKAAAIYKIPAGEYCIKYNLINGDTISNFPNESKDIIITDFKSYNGSWYTEQEFAFNKITTKISSDGTKELRYEYPTNQYTTVIKVNSSNAITYIYDYRSSVIFSIDVEVDKNTYDLFYTIYESIKVITPGTYKWVQNVELNFSAQMPLNFKSNGVNYSWFGVDNENSYYRLFYSTSSWGTPTVYDSSGWKLEAYKTFEVLSGCNIGRNSIAKQFINGKIAKQ